MFVGFERGSHIGKGGLEPLNLLPDPLRLWDYRHVPSQTALVLSLSSGGSGSCSELLTFTCLFSVSSSVPALSALMRSFYMFVYLILLFLFLLFSLSSTFEIATLYMAQGNFKLSVLLPQLLQ